MRKRILSTLLTLALCLSFIPTAALAEGEPAAAKTIMLGTSGIKEPTEVTNGSSKYCTPNSYIYFGMNGSTPIMWRVLDADKANDGTTSGMFLLSEYLLASGVSFNNNRSDGHVYQGSNAQSWCTGFVGNTSNFSTAEQGIMLGIAKNDPGEPRLYSGSWGESTLTANDKLFFLSARELADYVGNYDTAPGLAATYANGQSADIMFWWLRSSSIDPYTAAAVATNGTVCNRIVTSASKTRPALNLNSESVLFTSAAVGGKSGTVGSLSAIGDYSGSEWKLTLKDSTRSFSVTDRSAITVNTKAAFSLAYTGAATGTNEYISVIIADSSGVKYYGKVAEPTAADGTVSITIPNNFAGGTYTLHVFNEQCSDDKKSDYASAFSTMTLTVNDTAPVLTAGTVNGNGDTVTFTSDEAGTHYYAVVHKDAAAPSIDTSGTGAVCTEGTNTIFLTDLTMGAKDLYIVAKDAAGNVSELLKMEIPEFIPVYSISADPIELSFGSAYPDYTAPAAQSVTIQNWGNMTITLTQPAAEDTNYEIGELTKTSLAPSDTATFTLQPKSGLTVGTYRESIGVESVNDGNNWSSGIEVTFTVQNKPGGGSNGGESNGGSSSSGSSSGSSSSGSSGGSSNTTGTTTKNPEGSTTTTTTDKTTGTVTETTKNPDGSTTTVETKKDGTVTETNQTATGTTSTTVTDKHGSTETTVSVSRKDALSGETVTLPVDEVKPAGKSEDAREIKVDVPAGGATIEVPVKNPTPGTVLVIVDKDGNETVMPTTKLTENGVTVKLTENATIKVLDNSKTFDDVKPDNYFSEPVQWASARNITGGTSAATFGPQESCTRAQLVTFLWRAAGQPSAQGGSGMSDISKDSYYADAVAWAYENGIVGGYGNGQFGSGDTITREQMAVILYRFAWATGMDTTQGGIQVWEFADHERISGYAREAMQWAVNAGILQGNDGKLLPGQTCTRGQIVTMLYRAMNR